MAQLGAVLGREFAYEMLKAIAPMDEAQLQDGLSQLVEAELLYQRGRPPRAKSIFKHALIQDAAYESLLKTTRQQLHMTIARALEERFPDQAASEPELVAHHYTRAGLAARAIPFWLRAGQRAVAHFANLEASSHLNLGLELVTQLPDTDERARQELSLRLALGPALMIVNQYGGPEVERPLPGDPKCRPVRNSDSLS